jgi:hypothetical protein
MLNDHEPSEEELTVTYIEAASARISYAQFNPREEGRVGADWFWWFLDSTGVLWSPDTGEEAPTARFSVAY